MSCDMLVKNKKKTLSLRLEHSCVLIYVTRTQATLKEPFEYFFRIEHCNYILEMERNAGTEE